MSKYFRFQVILVGFLLLTLTATASSASFGGNCPCISLEEKLEMNLGLTEDSLVENFGERLNVGNITQEYVDAFGVGCAQHNEAQSENQWCYINPRNCDLKYINSALFHGLFFSYAACGDPDEYVRNTKRLRSVDLRMVIHDNHRGYQGTDCPSYNISNLTECDGTLVDLANILEDQRDKLNITYEIVQIPQWIKERAESYFTLKDDKENMTHAACVYATSLGAVDICLGAFTKNLNRALVSPFLEMGVTSEYLIVRKESDDKDARSMIHRIFAPFSLPLWIVTFIVLIILSLLFLIQEHSWSELKETDFNITFGLAVYNGILGFFATGHETDTEPLTWGGRFTLLAIAVQILLSTASYTANLTNFLVRDGYSTVVDNIDDAIQQGLKVCVLRNKISILNTAYGKNRIHYAKGPVYGSSETIDGFANREELLKGMDDGDCDCAILGTEDLTQHHGNGEHCDKKLVGTPVLELPWGIPVSAEFAPPLRMIMTEYMTDGKWNKIQQDARPIDVCPELDLDAEETQLQINHMAGAYVLSGFLAAIGIVCSLSRFANRKRRKNLSKKLPPPHNGAKIRSEDSEELEEPNTKPFPSSRADNRDLHAAMANIASEISELKQLVVFEREAKMPRGSELEFSSLFRT